MGAPRILRSAVEQLERGDWQAAHEIVQKDEESPLYCWAHGIVHAMEGDIPNARYWYARAGRREATGTLAEEWEALAALLAPRDPA